MKVVVPSERFVAFAEEQGCEAYMVPALDVERVDAKQLDPHFNQPFNWLVVTSQNTVRALENLQVEPSALQRDLRFRVACVGEKTAQACKNAGLSVDFVPPLESAKGILASNPLTGKIVLPQSSLSPETLEEGLKKQGCEVDAFTAYTVNLLKDDATKREVQNLLRAKEVKGFFCTSPSVAQVYLWLSEGFHDDVEFYPIGETTAEYLRGVDSDNFA